MKSFGLSVAALTALCLVACHLGERTTPASEAAAKTPRHTETFTGEVVKRNNEYRFRLLTQPQPEATVEPAPEQILRLTRANNASDFVSEEIHMRKYYGKTIVVKGQLDEDWIAKADIVGQWLRPGETRGSTLVGPEP